MTPAEQIRGRAYLIRACVYQMAFTIPTYGQGLTNPRHLTFQPKTGNLFVVEDSTKDVWCFAKQQAQPYQRIGTGLTAPNGVAFGQAGELFVVDYHDGVVIQIVDDQARTVICGLKNPYGIVVDAEGQLIVADAGNEAVKIFSPDDFALKHEFKVGFRPVDVALQNNGNLVALGYGGELLKLDPKTGVRLRGHASSKYHTTVGLAVDADDRIYVTQHQQKQLIVFDPELNPLGPVEGMPDLTMAWGLKAVGGGSKVVLYVAEAGRVCTFPIEFRAMLKKEV
jgi:DNA-binding beta-propeller fold protein YncE